MSAQTLIEDAGLRFDTTFVRDPQFYAALTAAPLVLAALSLLHPVWSSGWAGNAGVYIPAVLAFVLWQPFIEELLFRGVIQGRFAATRWGRRHMAGISSANLATSLLFVLAHLVNQSPWWAAAVLVPSLVFGHFRERHGSILPALVLHAAYNALFLVCVLYVG